MYRIPFSPRLLCRGLAACVWGLALGLASCDAALVDPKDNSNSESTLPDYVISSVQEGAEGPLDDLSTITFHVRVQNQGGRDMTGTFVYMYVDGKFKANLPLPSLSASNEATVTFQWPAEFGSHVFVFGVDTPPSNHGYVLETSEDNNTRSITLAIPLRERQIVGQDTIPFADLPSILTNHPQVAEVVALAADSGHYIPAGAVTLRTHFDVEGTTTFVTPVGPPDAAATTIPLLVITKTPAETLDTVVAAFLFQAVDSSTFLLYNTSGGTRISHDGSIDVFNSNSSGLMMKSTSNCTESVGWFCSLAGVAWLACTGSLMGLASPFVAAAAVTAVATCAARVFTTIECINSLIDHPPTIIIERVPHIRCGDCDDNDQDSVYQSYYKFEVSADDDRKAGGFTWSSQKVFSPTCDGTKSYTFVVTDCGGNTKSESVTAEGYNIETVPDACHDQGGTSMLFRTGSFLTRLTGNRGTLILGYQPSGRPACPVADPFLRYSRPDPDLLWRRSDSSG